MQKRWTNLRRLLLIPTQASSRLGAALGACLTYGYSITQDFETKMQMQSSLVRNSCFGLKSFVY